MSQVERATSLEEFLRQPESRPAREYINGKVVRKVSPKGKHSCLQAALVEHLNRVARPNRQGLAFPELRCTFARRSLVFDVAYYQWRRIPFDPNDEVPDDFLLPPDLAVEITSPGQRAATLVQKLRWCVKHGVPSGWLIQPRGRRVKTFHADGSAEELVEDARLDTSDFLDGFTCSVAELFGWLRPAR